MNYEPPKVIDYGVQAKTLKEQQKIQPSGLELLANSATRLKEPNAEGGANYGIDGCGCPCPAPCITPIEGTIIKGTIAVSSFTGTSVLH